MGKKKEPKFAMIFLSNAGSYPRAVMIKLSYTFTAIIAMFGSVFYPTVADIAVVMLRLFEAEELILLQRTRFEAWIFTSGEHQVSIDDQQYDKGDDICMFVLEKVVIFVQDEQDESLH